MERRDEILSFFDALGRRAVEQAVQVTPPALTNAAARGAIPASWAPEIEALCVASSVEFRRDLFKFRGASPALQPPHSAPSEGRSPEANNG